MLMCLVILWSLCGVLSEFFMLEGGCLDVEMMKLWMSVFLWKNCSVWVLICMKSKCFVGLMLRDV